MQHEDGFVRAWPSRAVGLFFVAGTAAAVAFIACREDDGCGDEQNPPPGWLDDTPRQRVCPSDTLTVTPSSLQIAPASNGDGDAGAVATSDASSPLPSSEDGGTSSATSSSSTATVSVLVRRDTGQPHEAATVDIRLCVPSVAPVIALNLVEADTRCAKLSDGWLTCTVDSNGTARFQVKALGPRTGSERVCVESLPKQVVANVQVGAPAGTVDAIALRNGDFSLADAPVPLSCTSPPQASVSCGHVISRPISLIAMREIATPTDSGVTFIDGGVGTSSGPVDVSLSIVPKTNLDAWLSTTANCRERPRSTSVHFDAMMAISDTAHLCTDGSQGAVTLVATFLSTTSTLHRNSPATFDIDTPGVPAILEAVADSDAGASSFRFVARDCRGSALAGVQVSLSTGATATTGKDGTTPPVSIPATDGGGVTAQTQTPQVGGGPSTCGLAISGGGR